MNRGKGNIGTSCYTPTVPVAHTKSGNKKQGTFSHTLLLVKKNVALRELKESIDSYKTCGQIGVDAERQIKNKINEVPREENDWETFRHHFEEIHPSFFIRLKEQYPKSDRKRIAAVYLLENKFRK